MTDYLITLGILTIFEIVSIFVSILPFFIIK